MRAHQLSSRWRVAVFLAVGMLALFALAACGSDDENAPAAGGPPTQAPSPAATPAPAATPTPAPAATPAPAPPAAAVVPVTAPEPGSDEEQILDVLEKQVRAVNVRDYRLFQETCTPSAGEPPALVQLKHLFEELGGTTGVYPSALRFSPEGYNVTNVEVKMLRAPFAQTNSNVYDHERFVTEDLQTWEKVDGKWYSDSDPCG